MTLPHGVSDRMLSEFKEMPGMALTVVQASRLFGVPLGECARILADLADGGLLYQGINGCYRLPVG